MSLERAKEFIWETFANPTLQLQLKLVKSGEEAMTLANNYGFSFTEEEMKDVMEEIFGTPQQRNATEDLKTIKLIDDVDFILQDHEKQFQKRYDEWLQEAKENPDTKMEDREFYNNGEDSGLSMTLKNILHHILKSESGTCCKAEDILDPLNIKDPSLFWYNVNYLPSNFTNPSYSELLVWCFDEDNLDKQFSLMIDYIEKNNYQCKTVFFLTTRWYSEVYFMFSDRIEILKENGINFTFVFFTTLGATEISTNPTSIIEASP